jgi:hypothetical protein
MLVQIVELWISAAVHINSSARGVLLIYKPRPWENRDCKRMLCTSTSDLLTNSGHQDLGFARSRSIFQRSFREDLIARSLIPGAPVQQLPWARTST